MLGNGVGDGDMSVRIAAIVLAALLAVPAALMLLRPVHSDDEPSGSPAHRVLEAVWVVVPIVLLAALIAFSVAA